MLFRSIGDWTKPNRMTIAEKKTLGERISKIIGLLSLGSLLAGAIFLARRNYRQGRGDRKGALRLASVIFALEMALFLCRTHFATVGDSFGLLVIAVSTGLFVSSVTWLLYLAVEPWVRRHWPQTIISWTRLMSGRYRDPLVGRDLVLGIALGLSWILAFEIGTIFRMRNGAPPQLPSADYLMGASSAAGTLLSTLMISIIGTLLFFVTLVVIRVLVRNRWLAAVLFVALFTIPRILGSDHMLADALVWITIYGIAAISAVRFGLIVLGLTNFTADVLLNVPCTLNFSYWYASQSFFIVLIFVAIGAWGVYTSLAGKPLWKGDLLD